MEGAVAELVAAPALVVVVPRRAVLRPRGEKQVQPVGRAGWLQALPLAADALEEAEPMFVLTHLSNFL